MIRDYGLREKRKTKNEKRKARNERMKYDIRYPNNDMRSVFWIRRSLMSVVKASTRIIKSPIGAIWMKRRTKR